MAIIKEMIDTKSLKEGDIYLPHGTKNVFFKITEVTTSKVGKHGSAKNIAKAKNIIDGKSREETFKDSDEKVYKIVNFDYKYKPIYIIEGSEMITDMETMSSIFFQDFKESANVVEEALKKVKKENPDAVNNSNGDCLVIKYSEVGDEQNTLLFWEFLYVAPVNFSKFGIKSEAEGS